MNGFVLINASGEYAVVTNRTTHTGYHTDISFTKELNEASVFVSVQKLQRKYAELRSCIALPAYLNIVRTVTLVKASQQ